MGVLPDTVQGPGPATGVPNLSKRSWHAPVACTGRILWSRAQKPQTGDPRGLLSHLHAREPAAAAVPRRPRLRLLAADACAYRRAVRLELSRVLRDAEPFPPAHRDAGAHPERRHAPPQRLLRAAVQRAVRGFRPRLSRPVWSEPDRRRPPVPRELPLHRPESCPGKPPRRSGEVALEQLPRDRRFRSIARLPHRRRRARSIRRERSAGASTLPAVRRGRPCPGTWSQGDQTRVSSLKMWDWPGSTRTKLRPNNQRYRWSIGRNFVRLDPGQSHIFKLET